jgi:hypothetical protein
VSSFFNTLALLSMVDNFAFLLDFSISFAFDFKILVSQFCHGRRVLEDFLGLDGRFSSSKLLKTSIFSNM